MNKRQLEVLKRQMQNEKKVIQHLKRVYQQASMDCERKIRELAGRTDMENLQSIIYQKQYQEMLKKQLDDILDALQNKEFETIAEYLTGCYEDGFLGTLYDIHGQGIPLIFPIDQAQVVEAVQTDSKISTNLYTRLGEDVSHLKKSIRAELARGISNGSTWAEIAVPIAHGMNSPFRKAMNNAMRIARTEGHRIQNCAQMDTLNKAKEKGADVVKQWISTLDDRTRETHKILDGQIREIEDYFEVNGHRAKYPGGFGVASEDIHCRCCMGQRAKWNLDQDELDTLKDRAAFFGIDKSKDFKEFKEKYLQLPADTDTINLGNATWLYIESKTIKEAEEFVKGFGVQNVSYKGVDIKVANAMNQALTDAFNYCPGLSERMNFYGVAQERNKMFKAEMTSYYVGYLKNKFGTIYSDAEIQKMAKSFASKSVGKIPSNCYAFASNTSSDLDADIAAIVNKYSGICVNKLFGSDYAAFTKSVERSVQSKFHPIGCDTVKSVFDHEFGHQLDYAAGVRDDSRVKKLWSNFRGLSPSERDDALSRYAHDDDKIAEFIAEGYAEYVNSDSPREYAKAIGEIVDELTKTRK